MPAFVTAKGFLARPSCSAPGGTSTYQVFNTYQVFLFRALLQSWASQEQFLILHLPSCEANTVNSPSSSGGWKRDICGALSNCTWHMVLRCAREDGWQRTTLLWFFCLLPLSSMMIARDINAEEPEKKWNGKTQGKAIPAYTVHSSESKLIWSDTRHSTNKLCCCWCTSTLNNHSDTKESLWLRQSIRIRENRRPNPVTTHDLGHITPLHSLSLTMWWSFPVWVENYQRAWENPGGTHR